MKKALSLIVVGFMCACLVLYFSQGVKVQSDDVTILKIYNWEEYISEDQDDKSIDVISLFENYCKETLNENVVVEYSTFGTNENMYNELNLSKITTPSGAKYSYDLVCPSEYMLLKMMRENMLEKLDYSLLPNYTKNASPYIQNLFKTLVIDDKALSDYSSCYMWGTMGFVYNPEKVDEEDAKHWNLLWKDEYKNQGTIKDSVRDSYILAIGKVYETELKQILTDYNNGLISTDEYNKKLTEVYNRTDEETVNLVGEQLTILKDKIYGYEVDSGKKEMAQGKISINFAWSGDGVYTLDVAEEDGTYLNYVVPEEGSNIFFDGWAIPKGGNVKLAHEFINFLARPEIAKMNMEYIGYTSAIASDVMFENALDWYGYSIDSFDETIEGITKTEENGITTYSYEEKADLELALEEGKEEAYDVTYRWQIENGETTYFITENYYTLNEDGTAFELSEEGEEFEVFPVDLSYFFGELEEYSAPIILSAELNRQFYAQYPDLETINRCTVMKCFTDDETRTLNNMWETAKVGRTNDISLLITIIAIVVAIVCFIVLYKLYKNGKIFQPKGIKGYKLTKIDF